MHTQVHVTYSGRVQGVGFRFTAVSLAGQMKVVGWVKNLSVGGVELVAEQKKEVLEDFLGRLEEEFAGYITDRDLRWESASGAFKDFDIRYK